MWKAWLYPGKSLPVFVDSTDLEGPGEDRIHIVLSGPWSERRYSKWESEPLVEPLKEQVDPDWPLEAPCDLFWAALQKYGNDYS